MGCGMSAEEFRSVGRIRSEFKNDRAQKKRKDNTVVPELEAEENALGRKIASKFDDNTLLNMHRAFRASKLDAKKGLVFEEFCRIFKLSSKRPVVKRLFDMYDFDGTGHISAREFMIGLYSWGKLALKDTEDFIFTLADGDGKGYIVLDDLVMLLQSAQALEGQSRAESREAARALFLNADVDNDGRIDKYEFKALCQGHAQAMFPCYELAIRQNSFSKRVIGNLSFRMLQIGKSYL